MKCLPEGGSHTNIHTALFPMNEDLTRKVRRALERSWSYKTSICYSPSAAPSYGQCAPTAIVIWEYFGGEILKTDGWPPNGSHFYNQIDGTRYDFTADQFKMPDYSHQVNYKDILSNVAEAESETMPGQVAEMRSAFKKAFNKA
jgi:hypothetical protein